MYKIMPIIGPRCGFILLKRSVSCKYIDAAVHSKRAISTKFQQVSSVNMILQLRQGGKNVDVRKTHSTSETNRTTIKDERRELMAIWPDVVRDLTDTDQHPDIPEVNKWMAKVLQYNVPTGKLVYASALVKAYKQLVPPDHLTEENVRLACILGWCIELLKGSLLLLDDIEDGSTVRRGQPAWYLHNGYGLAAINDGLLLEQAMYQLLRTHFQHKDCYIDLVKTFQEMTWKTLMGQCLDLLLTNHGGTSMLDHFTMDKYNTLCTYKAGYYVVLPARVAMYFAGLRDREMHKEAETIVKNVGRFFQIENDYNDCYGDPASTGKGEGESDIHDGKCTWLVTVALQRATAQQKKILEECYGSKDPEKVARVKQLYNDLDLPNIYATYAEESYDLLTKHIQQLSPRLPHNLFLTIRDSVYRKRSCIKL